MTSLEYVRSFRVGPITIFDTALAVAGMVGIASYLDRPLWQGVVLTLPAAVVSHWLTGIPTPLNTALGLN